MIETFKRIVTTEHEIQINKINKSVAVKTPDAQYFVSRRDLEWAQRKKSDIFGALDSIERKYIYPPQEFWQEYDKNGLYDKALYMLDDDSIPAFDAVELDDFDEDNIIWFSEDDHMMYKLDAEFPISPVIFQDYIVGVAEDCYDLRKAYEILNDCPYVWDLQEMEIPYYNAEPERSRALEFFVRLPQDKWEYLVSRAREYSPEHWPVHASDWILYKKYYEEGLGIPDYLGLKDAWIDDEWYNKMYL